MAFQNESSLSLPLVSQSIPLGPQIGLGWIQLERFFHFLGFFLSQDFRFYGIYLRNR